MHSASATNDPAAVLTQPPTQPPIGPEQDLWSGRTSFRHFAGPILIWLVINVAVVVGVIYLARGDGKLTWTGGIWIVLIAIVFSAVLILRRPFGNVLGIRYRLTSQRLFIERGLLGTTTDQMELTRVEDIRVQKTLMDRVLGVGTIDLLSNDVTDRSVTIEGITEPDTVAELIRARMRNLRGRSVFVENLSS